MFSVYEYRKLVVYLGKRNKYDQNILIKIPRMYFHMKIFPSPLGKVTFYQLLQNYILQKEINMRLEHTCSMRKMHFAIYFTGQTHIIRGYIRRIYFHMKIFLSLVEKVTFHQLLPHFCSRYIL